MHQQPPWAQSATTMIVGGGMGVWVSRGGGMCGRVGGWIGVWVGRGGGMCGRVGGWIGVRTNRVGLPLLLDRGLTAAAVVACHDA